MPTLHLGVVELPYNHARTSRQKLASHNVTTGDVAEFLESNYEVMHHFVDLHGQQIGDALAHGMAGTLENLLMGGPVTQNPFGSAESAIEKMFKKDFLEKGEMDRLGIPGVPTQAAKDRASGKKRSSRMKKRRASNSKPVSFIDTGLYESSFKAWVE